MFRKILIEEENARTFYEEKEDNFVSFLKVQGFGDSGSAADEIKKFYTYWENFVSCKTFAWADVYKVEKDHDRHIKRLIDQENKRARKRAKRKYMDIIRYLDNNIGAL